MSMGEIVQDMIRDGFRLAELSINDEVFNGKLVKNLEFMGDYVYFEYLNLYYFTPLNKVDMVILGEVEE